MCHLAAQDASFFAIRCYQIEGQLLECQLALAFACDIAQYRQPMASVAACEEHACITLLS